jgi:hypothetical protein
MSAGYVWSITAGNSVGQALEPIHISVTGYSVSPNHGLRILPYSMYVSYIDL